MKTKVTDTSILSFHAHNGLETQRMAVARFILAETRAGRWTWISKISDNAEKIGHFELAQKSSASRALNELKKQEILIEGELWVIVSGRPFRPPGAKRMIEPWAIVLKK